MKSLAVMQWVAFQSTKQLLLHYSHVTMFCNLIGAANSLAVEVNMQFENYQAVSSPIGTRLETLPVWCLPVSKQGQRWRWSGQSALK